jgi:hypothetical protein
MRKEMIAVQPQVTADGGGFGDVDLEGPRRVGRSLGSAGAKWIVEHDLTASPSQAGERREIVVR